VVRALIARCVALACVLAGLLLAAPAAQGQSPFEQNGVLFVHGFVGTGGQFESQKLRFMSNGYPERWIDTIDYDSTFATESRSQVHARIDALIADLKQRTGRPKVDLLGHSLGTSVLQEYLNSSAERAANVAHYVNIDGGQADAPPGGVPTLAIWAGRGQPGRRIAGAANVTLPNQTHVESATSAEAFREYHKFFTGREPAHDIVPEAGRITIAGRVLIFPLNKGALGSTLTIWEVDAGTGQRKGSAALASTAIGESGNWGPVTVTAGRHYEFEVTRPGAPAHHHYYEPFVRSDHLVRLLESDLLANGAERGPRHAAAVILRYKELWGDQPGQNDVLSVNGTNICTEVLCPISKRVNAFFFSDRKLDGQSDLSQPDPTYNALPFVTGVDLFAPAAIPPAGKTTVEIRSRGGGPTRAVNLPNFASVTDVATVQLRDFDRTDSGAPCLRPATIGFKLHRMEGTRVVRVEAFVNGKRKLVRRGRDIRRVELESLVRAGKLAVRVVATHNTGSRVVSTRSWSGCTKGKPRVRRIPRPR
jgi:pimeloyl-ACP methyl ester carboxylesterase